ncbi:permease, partial [Bifidobacterium breve]|nr:permease [Bifidobacterium breve]
KRCRLCGQRDYRIIQVMLFDLVLPGAIVYPFATNPHDPSLLWLSAFGFVVALVPVLVIFSATRHSPVTQRAFL